MNSDNYPMGADTPDAPWRQESPEPCEKCGGSGEVPCPECNELRLDNKSVCIECDGGGFIECNACDGTGESETPSQRIQRIAEEKADADHDAARDEEIG